jgi:hypothetical protein
MVLVGRQCELHSEPDIWPSPKRSCGTRLFGSGRAILTLRESYRNDLRAVREITGFKYVRFHAIFHDEVGVYDEDTQGNPIYNFSSATPIPPPPSFSMIR